jgi:hypothetical protein
MGYFHTFQERSKEFQDVYLGNSTTSMLFNSAGTNNWYQVYSYIKVNPEQTLLNTLLFIRVYSSKTPFLMSLTSGFIVTL